MLAGLFTLRGFNEIRSVNKLLMYLNIFKRFTQKLIKRVMNPNN